MRRRRREPREHAALFAAIGIAYGRGDGATSFNLPDFRDRVVVGKSATKDRGATGGAETHRLTVDELPSHSHDAGTLAADNAGAHRHTVPRGGSGAVVQGFSGGYSSAGSVSTSQAGEHGHDISGSTGDTGGGQAHNIMQPYGVARYIIKT